MGLKEDLRAEVRLLNPIHLEQAMEIALRVEDKHKLVGAVKGGWSGNRTSTILTAQKSLTTGLASSGSITSPFMGQGSIAGVTDSSSSSHNSGTKSTTAPTKLFGEVRCLFDKEFQDKRAKGLCFKCDDKWSMGHRCKNKELSVLWMDGEAELESQDEGEQLVDKADEPTPEVSLNLVIGLSSPKTMKLRGLIGDRTVVVIIVPGATHNFIALGVVKELGLAVTDSGSFGVHLGNGEAIREKGVCKNVQLHLDGGVE